MPSATTSMHAGLHVFACAARHLSFTRAAGELNVTTGAVSQQIRLLEERLGFRLFHRHPRRLSLTAEGERLAEAVLSAHGRIDQELKRLSRGLMSGELILRCVPSFLTRWLMPRLPRLQAQLPALDIYLHAEDSDRALTEENFDLAIDLGNDHYPGMASTLLMEEIIFPVCAPSLFSHRPALNHPDRLAHYPLLHDVTAWRGSSPHGEWHHYLEAIGADPVGIQRGYSFNRHDLTMEAARAGMGIAIARQTLLRDELSSGQLIAPLPQRVNTGRHYAIVHAFGALDDPRIRAVHDWICAEARRTPGA
ncbi:LysR substrate-binding domain-containing protein [Kushneria sp. Sum13]|uniref:LysR substrate-binding domain-containing protein n=1 Tax=Kushneria sp. Sum13 TaxID=3459196 RepID=UPI004045FC19